MTPQELEEQSKQAVIAYLQDSSVRLEMAVKLDLSWERHHHDTFYMGIHYYRIAQPKRCYRVFECKDGSLGITCSEHDNEKIIENQYRFKRWLTDRVEYDND